MEGDAGLVRELSAESPTGHAYEMMALLGREAYISIGLAHNPYNAQTHKS